MKLTTISVPAVFPITLTEAKLKLRIDTTEDDADVIALIKAATAFFEDLTGLRFITQTLEAALDYFPGADYIEFDNCSPVQSITSIKYKDSMGVEYTVAATDYELDTYGNMHRVVLKNAIYWPVFTPYTINPIKMRFIAGYGLAVSVPEAIKQAMLLHMKLFYDQYAPDEMAALEKARNSLLSTYRVRKGGL